MTPSTRSAFDGIANGRNLGTSLLRRRATVRCNCRLRDMNTTVRVDDERVLEVLESWCRSPSWCLICCQHHFWSALTAAGPLFHPVQLMSTVRRWQGHDVTKRGSTVSCSKEITATWLWLVPKRVADGARRRVNSSIPWPIPAYACVKVWV